MKLIQYAMAWAALPLLADKDLPYRTAWELVKLKRRIKPAVDFLLDEERRLAREYGECDNDGRLVTVKGRFRFAGDDEEQRAKKAAEFLARRDALYATEDGEEPERIRMSLATCIMMRPSAIEALEPFIEFCEEEEA